jgi:hypothetical protein
MARDDANVVIGHAAHIQPHIGPEIFGSRGHLFIRLINIIPVIHELAPRELVRREIIAITQPLRVSATTDFLNRFFFRTDGCGHDQISISFNAAASFISLFDTD